MQEYLEIGKIVNTHGVKGEVKILPLTDDVERFNKLKWVFIEKENNLEKYSIENVKFLKGFVLIKFKEVSDMNAAEALKGLLMKVDRRNAVKLPKDAYFICDLIDCDVFDTAGKVLGKMKSVLKTGSNDVYVVSNEESKDILIPALKSVVKEISIEDRKIVVSLPEGLVDDEI
ncbi:MAG: ribosome maturation factor RimM [Clostridia bacterium]|nr:ribosome maturation factor RimM [Clostridia bacterium]